MFYDERIITAKGKAFRHTIFLAFCLFTGYFALHLTYLLVCLHRLPILSLIFEFSAAVTSGVILAVGEIRRHAGPEDERSEAENDLYYAKGFSRFLCILAAVYCIFAPIAAASRISGDYPPNAVLTLVLVPCWLFLLTRFKQTEVTINPGFLDEPRSEYWRCVFRTVKKFGLLCLFFTLLGVTADYLFLLSISRRLSFTVVTVIGVLVSGFLTFLSISAEYLLFSYAERASEQAKVKGKTSKATRLFLWLSVAMNVLFSAERYFTEFVLTAPNGLFPNTPLGDRAAILNYLGKDLGNAALYFTVLFLLWLYSELRTLRDNRLRRLLLTLALYEIAQCIFSFFLTQFVQIPTTLHNDIDFVNSLFTALSVVNSVVWLGFCVLLLFAAIHAVRRGLLKIAFLPVFVVSSLMGLSSLTALFAFLGTPLKYVFCACLTIAFRIAEGILLNRALCRMDERGLLTPEEDGLSDTEQL